MDSYQNPVPGKTYVSPRLYAFSQPNRKVKRLPVGARVSWAPALKRTVEEAACA